MKFKQVKQEKYTNTQYWVASIIGEGQGVRDIHWIIYPKSSGYTLFLQVGISKKSIVCHVRKLKSAKTIANLIQNG